MKISENYFRRQNQKFKKLRKTHFCIRPRNLQSKFEPNRMKIATLSHILKSWPPSLYSIFMLLRLEPQNWTTADLGRPFRTWTPIFELERIPQRSWLILGSEGAFAPQNPPSPPSLSRRVPVYLLSFFFFFFIPFSFLCLLNLIFIFCLTFVLLFYLLLLLTFFFIFFLHFFSLF